MRGAVTALDGPDAVGLSVLGAVGGCVGTECGRARVGIEMGVPDGRVTGLLQVVS